MKWQIFRLAHLLAAMMLLQPALAAVYETSEPVDFSLPQLNGEPLALSEFRGQWVVLNYWATWCAPCRKEIPELSALHQQRQDVTVLGIAYEDVDAEMFEEFPHAGWCWWSRSSSWRAAVKSATGSPLASRPYFNRAKCENPSAVTLRRSSG